MATIFDDGRYIVTESAFSTRSRLYPLAHATARIRRDLVWLALGVGGLSVATLSIYADLLTTVEMTVAVLLPIVAILVAANMGILEIDTPSHPRALIVARPKKVRAIFDALRRAKLAEISGSAVSIRDEGQAEMDFGK